MFLLERSNNNKIYKCGKIEKKMVYGYNLNSFARNVKKDGLASALIEDGKQTLYHIEDTSISTLDHVKKDILFCLAVSIATPIALYEIYKSRKSKRK